MLFCSACLVHEDRLDIWRWVTPRHPPAVLYIFKSELQPVRLASSCVLDIQLCGHLYRSSHSMWSLEATRHSHAWSCMIS